jgi:hypothetical protein
MLINTDQEFTKMIQARIMRLLQVFQEKEFVLASLINPLFKATTSKAERKARLLTFRYLVQHILPDQYDIVQSVILNCINAQVVLDKTSKSNLYVMITMFLEQKNDVRTASTILWTMINVCIENSNLEAEMLELMQKCVIGKRLLCLEMTEQGNQLVHC